MPCFLTSKLRTQRVPFVAINQLGKDLFYIKISLKRVSSNPRFIALDYSELLRNYVEPDGSSDSHAMADIHNFYHR